MVTYIRSDLEFILEQIKISELHAAGQPLYGVGGLVPAYNVSAGLRTVDGSFNHLLAGQEKWGAADQPFPGLLDPAYRPADGDMFDPDGPGPAPAMPTQQDYTPSNDPGSLVFDRSLRTISNLLVDQTLGNPAAIMEALSRAGTAPENISALLVKVAQVTAIYTAFKPSSDAEYQARVVMNNANAAARAAGDDDPNTPPDAAEQAAIDAAAAATAAHALTLADLEAARVVRDAAVAGPDFGIVMDGDNVSLPNVSPDVGLSASFNSWFTLFGQFFDHGLDLVNKGGSGTVFIPLAEDDPLYVPGSSTNFMALTRATVSAGPDGDMGTADDVRPVNTTTAYVDQNQTYTSHASHQVFLRQYMLNADGKPVSTGKLIEGGGGMPGGMATWVEVKAQALMLGILLTDQDVGSVPLLRTDQYGKFIPSADGYAQVITGIGDDGIPNTADDTVISGTPGAPVGLETAVRIGHAFLADIAHTAVPTGLADGDIEIGLQNPGNAGADTYDNELLDAHFMAGDGRVNENIGLTAVHHVFHAEHNRLVEHTKSVLLASNDVAFLNEWLVDDVGAMPVNQAQIDALVWDGERLFQAAKFGTEMQYQHLVFEEFARKVQPQIDFFIVPDGFDTTINPDIVAEFAHVVYRFGHSMLTETIDRYDSSFNDTDIGLIEGFLNPIAFDNGHAVGDGIAAGDIIRGMTRQVGNEIDEFVTGALRNNLLGLPLDLATINLARGRDTGVPSLNAARRDFYAMTNDSAVLKPYESWVEFAGNLKNEASIINFIAAYGLHPTILAATTLEEKRDAALALIFDSGGAIPDSSDFLNGTGAWASDVNGVTTTGLDTVDLWIGGLAEKILPFGGMLGSTFNFVFETQMENLQNGDRFYYLQRLDGLHLFSEMEGNSFAGMIMRNTDATHLPSDVFSVPGLILEVDQTRQYNDLDGDGQLEQFDPGGLSILTQVVSRNNPGTVGPDSNYLRYNGDQHVVLGGTDNADIIIASEGDDTIFGDGGNDRLEGGAGNDIINAGDGDDIVTDLGGDDNVKLGDGHDVINTGPGLDLVLAGRGQDFVVLGTDAGSEVFGGEGNDFVLGNITAERILGNEGDDWIEHGTFDGAPGDNFDEIFARDGIDGHDVFFGLGGFDEYIGEGGDDIMVGSLGVNKVIGMSGFDWATYKDNKFSVNADFFRQAFDANPVPPPNAALDVYEAVEGMSGSAFDDTLSGSDETALTLPLQGYKGSALDAAGIARISGLQAVLGAGVTSFNGGDIILGGDGSDVITGRGGDDIIDGDKWLNVRISVREHVGPNGGTGAEIDTANSMTELVTEMFNRTYNPGQLQIVREILSAPSAGDTDVAVFSDLRANYDIITNPNGTTTVIHARGTETDGTDTLRNIERMRFSDVEVPMNTPATGAPTINDQTPTEGQVLTSSVVGIADVNGLGAFSRQWQSSADGLLWTNIAGATGVNFTPQNLPLTTPGAQGGLMLRVAVSFTDGLGNLETVVSQPTGVVGLDWNGLPAANNIFDGNAGNDDAEGVNPAGGVGGNDTLNGNAGDDNLRGLGGNDTMNGGSGNDLMTGGDGLDTMSGGSNNDSMNGNAGNDTMNGDGGDDVMQGGAGVDTMSGGIDDDTITGDAGDDVLNGDAGNDTLAGGGNNDMMNGGAGNDTITGNAGTDTVVYAGAVTNFHLSRDGVTTITDVGGFEGTDTVVLTEVLRFAGVDYNVVAGTVGNNNNQNGAGGAAGSQAIFGLAGNDVQNGGAGADILSGDIGNDTLNGGADADLLMGGANNDIVRGDGGDDLISQAAGTDGRDSVDGGADSDTYRLLGDLSAETFRIYTRVEALAQITGLVIGANTEIVVTRNGTSNADVIAELDNIEELVVNTLNVTPVGPGAPVGGVNGGDTVQIFGDFTQTSLSFNTITIDGGEGDDTVDISSLQSQHRIVFRSRGGKDAVIGTLRPQDIVELAAGTVLANYALTTADDGRTTASDGVNSVSFASDGLPELRVAGSDTLSDDDAAGETEAEVDEDDAPEPGVTLTSGDDRWVGTSADDMVRAGAGDDVVKGGSGDDALTGGSGDDSLSGGSGDDVLTGGSGDDTLSGGSGDDVLDGGSGDDTLTGGSGKDSFVFGDGDRVTDFDAEDDLIDVSALGVTAANFAEMVSLVSAGADTVVNIGNMSMRLSGVSSADLTIDAFQLATGGSSGLGDYEASSQPERADDYVIPAGAAALLSTDSAFARSAPLSEGLQRTMALVANTDGGLANDLWHSDLDSLPAGLSQFELENYYQLYI